MADYFTNICAMISLFFSPRFRGFNVNVAKSTAFMGDLLNRYQQDIVSNKYFINKLRFFSTERAGKVLKPGAGVVVDGNPHRVSKIIQGKRGKGGGFVKATLKNLINGNVFEKTFTTDEMVEQAELDKEAAQYSWADDHNFIFMNSTTFEETSVPKADIENSKFLVEGQAVKLLMFKGAVIGVELPVISEYTIVSLSNAESGSGYAATLNSGAIVTVPAFVKEGSNIRVNTELGTYVERVL